MIRRGSTQEKIILLLMSGLALSLTRSPRGHFKIIRSTRNAWRNINKRYLRKSITDLYKSKLILEKNNKDGTTTFILSDKGREIALTYNIDKLEIKKHNWDNKWRIVIFDIPEKKKKVREILRYQLKRLGFIELQHSVFVLPYECRNEIEYIIEFYNIRKFVRYMEVTHIDNELDLRNKFNLL